MNRLYKFLVLFFAFLAACSPQEDDKIVLGPPPQDVSFDITPTGEPNQFTFRNTTPGTFLHQWDFGNGLTAEGEEVVADFPFKGEYIITLSAFNEGGFGRASRTLVIEEDAPTPCLKSAPFFAFVTGGSSRAWRMNTDPGAYWVGPHDGSTTWWASDANIVAERPCAFDDEWIFSNDCMMEYDTKGDLWAEDYMGFNFECITDDQLAPDQAAWGSGVHRFSVTAGAIPQLTLTGLGAFIGFPKVANGAEVTLPQPEVTYDVIKYEEQANRYFIELQIDFGAGFWRFQIISDK